MKLSALSPTTVTQELKPSFDLNCLSYVNMDKLSKQQKDEYATVFAILALYDGEVSIMAVGGNWMAPT